MPSNTQLDPEDFAGPSDTLWDHARGDVARGLVDPPPAVTPCARTPAACHTSAAPAGRLVRQSRSPEAAGLLRFRNLTAPSGEVRLLSK